MPLILSVTKSPLSTMCCAASAWLASASSSRGGVKREANWTAAKIANRSAHAPTAEGARSERDEEARSLVMVWGQKWRSFYEICREPEDAVSQFRFWTPT